VERLNAKVEPLLTEVTVDYGCRIEGLVTCCLYLGRIDEQVIASAGLFAWAKRVAEVDSSCRLLIVPLFRGSSRFESLILSHLSCECNKEEIDDDDDDDDDELSHTHPQFQHQAIGQNRKLERELMMMMMMMMVVQDRRTNNRVRGIIRVGQPRQGHHPKL